MTNLKTVLLAVALAAAPLAAAAQLGPEKSGDVRYLCGGVGASEQQEMRAAARSYDLMLTFAVTTGQYLADVDVEIANQRGQTLLSARCDGPMMLVDLPASGRYQVRANAGGRELRRNVSTDNGRKLARAVFTWPTASLGQ